jgi:predicted aconitase
MQLTEDERALAADETGRASGIAMRIVAEAGALLGADRLIPVASSHIDGALYHGHSGTAFAERLVAAGARTAVPATLNVGSLDLIHPDRVHLRGETREMALRLMNAYLAMGCKPTWTCAPYQAGHRPALGQDVAWGESNAVAFCNSVLGARTNRYGDFMDIACALIGKAPRYGLHLRQNRRARIVVDTMRISSRLKRLDAFYPVLGSWFGSTVGGEIGAILGLQGFPDEDDLKAFGAAAATSGAVGLFHIVGVTPEAPSLAAILAQEPIERIVVEPKALRDARDALSTATGDQVDVIAVGSPHFSLEEFASLELAIGGRRLVLPFFANTSRAVWQRLEEAGRRAALEDSGITFVLDTCVVTTPILVASAGVLMTNSGKFAHYAPSNIGYAVHYGSLAECVETAVAGHLVRSEESWS